MTAPIHSLIDNERTYTLGPEGFQWSGQHGAGGSMRCACIRDIRLIVRLALLGQR